MAGFADLLVDAKPPETSGARSANRFDYQKDWALCLLLRLHEQGGDYLLLLEHHDDVAVVDAADAPTKVAFFQIKTASKPWTVPALTKPGKGATGPTPSILGKLFHHGKVFGSSVQKLCFVSNAHFNVKLANGSGGEGSTHICFVQLSEEEKAKARERLKLELGVEPPLPWEGVAFLVVDDLSVKDHAAHAKGKLSEYLEKIGAQNSPIGAIYRALADEVRRRSSFEGTCHSLKDLATNKGISRAQFQTMLARTAVGPLRNAWHACDAQLVAEGVTFTEIQHLRSSWIRHEVNRMDAGNLPVQALRRTISSKLTTLLKADSKLKLIELAATIAPELTRPATYTDDDIRAAIMLETYALGQDGQLQAPDPEPEEAGT